MGVDGYLVTIPNLTRNLNSTHHTGATVLVIPKDEPTLGRVP